MALVKLIRHDGLPIYVNPASLLCVEHGPRDGQVGLRFAVIVPNTGYPYSEVVRGSLEQVVTSLEDEVQAAFQDVYGGAFEPLPRRAVALDGDRDF